MKKFVAILLLFAMPLLQGCGIGILAAGVGHAVGQGRKGTAKIMEAKSKYAEQYNNYKIEMEKINLEREKSGLEIRPIITFEEYLEQQPLSPEEVKLFRKQGVLTAKDIKEQKESKEE